MNLGNVKSGSKLILTKEFTTPARNKWDTGRTLPKNLVLSLNSLKINRQGTTLIFQVLRAKAVREKYYTDFNIIDIRPSVRLKGNDAKLFINEAEFRDFDEEYWEITENKNR
jgi:hypothetical protein